MKIFRVLAGVLAVAGAAWAFQAKPINDTCPVKGGAVKGITTTYKGKVIAFC